MSYVDDYGTCERTFATLRIYPPGQVELELVSTLLGLAPSSKNEAKPGVRGWFLSTEGEVSSQDVRRHIDWILERVQPCASGLRQLQEMGAATDVFCYWLSRFGHGGPALSPQQTGLLAKLRLDRGFDVYFGGGRAG
jgi:hypothetical protein